MSAAQAHDPGLSTAEVIVGSNRLEVLLTFSPADAQVLSGVGAEVEHRTGDGLSEALRRSLEETGAVRVEWDGHRVEALHRDIFFDSRDNVQIRIHYPVRPASRLGLHSLWLADLPLGHRQFWSIRDEAGKLRTERLLDVRTDAFETETARGKESVTVGLVFRQFFLLGVEHILEGFDHLLFLLGLLLLGSSVLAAAKIITSFTLAHSLTLVLATLHLVEIPPNLVELLIAFSIVYVGMESFVGGNPKPRWLLTFAFGLVHGLGFASLLREMNLDAGGAILLPLVSFNLGVEAGQMAAAGLLLPLIWQVRRLSHRSLPVCALLVALAGSVWLLERTLEVF